MSFVSTSTHVTSFSIKIKKFTCPIKNINTIKLNTAYILSQMRSREGLSFFFNSFLCSQFFFCSSDIFSLLHFLETLTQETSWDIDRGQHLYTSTLEWALAFSTQETSWDIDRGWTSHWIFLRYQPKRRRETSTGGRYLDTSTLEWALEVSFLSWVFFLLENSRQWIFKNNTSKNIFF